MNVPPEVGKKYICVEIDEEGRSTVEAFGFTGRTCEAVTRGVESALGAVTKRTAKRGEKRKERQRAGH